MQNYYNNKIERVESLKRLDITHSVKTIDEHRPKELVELFKLIEEHSDLRCKIIRNKALVKNTSSFKGETYALLITFPFSSYMSKSYLEYNAFWTLIGFRYKNYCKLDGDVHTYTNDVIKALVDLTSCFSSKRTEIIYKKDN